MSGRTQTWNLLTGAVTLLLGLPSAALAQSEADFFKGKTVNYIISTAPGGGYDYYGRLVAEYMQKHRTPAETASAWAFCFAWRKAQLLRVFARSC